MSASRVRARDLLAMKHRSERWPMLTSYDQYTAEIFDQHGVPVLLVGDSASNNVYGHETTLPVTLDEMVPLVRAVVGATQRAMVVADLPFGTYEASAEQALASGVRMMKEAGAGAVKLEGGADFSEQITALTRAGIPVMGHVGFTPQRVHTLGGYRVQGRAEGAKRLLLDALAVQDAGAFAIVLEMTDSSATQQVMDEVRVPVIGIGAGATTDAQVLVWQDMSGLRDGPMPRFVKKYADLRSVLGAAVDAFSDDVRSGAFPSEEHSY